MKTRDRVDRDLHGRSNQTGQVDAVDKPGDDVHKVADFANRNQSVTDRLRDKSRGKQGYGSGKTCVRSVRCKFIAATDSGVRNHRLKH